MPQNEEIMALAAAIAERLERNFTVMPTITLSEAAKQLGVSDETVRKLCQSGKLPCIRLEKLYRIKPKDINDYLDKCYQ